MMTNPTLSRSMQERQIAQRLEARNLELRSRKLAMLRMKRKGLRLQDFMDDHDAPETPVLPDPEEAVPVRISEIALEVRALHPVLLDQGQPDAQEWARYRFQAITRTTKGALVGHLVLHCCNSPTLMVMALALPTLAIGLKLYEAWLP
jgi:hypothetical protein